MSSKLGWWLPWTVRGLEAASTIKLYGTVVLNSSVGRSKVSAAGSFGIVGGAAVWISAGAVIIVGCVVEVYVSTSVTSAHSSSFKPSEASVEGVKRLSRSWSNPASISACIGRSFFGNSTKKAPTSNFTIRRGRRMEPPIACDLEISWIFGSQHSQDHHTSIFSCQVRPGSFAISVRSCSVHSEFASFSILDNSRP